MLQEEGNLLELVDPCLGSNYSREEAMAILTLVLLCTDPTPALRPKMSAVVSMLEGKVPVQAVISVPADSNQDGSEHPVSQKHSILTDGPWIPDSSGSSGFRQGDTDVTALLTDNVG